ncbi:MAG: hypothetical protein M3O15_06680 [Acidobacteriota bacterium]|nr:hypothetical protein [Acidobacteriota bacterium]
MEVSEQTQDCLVLRYDRSAGRPAFNACLILAAVISVGLIVLPALDWDLYQRLRAESTVYVWASAIALFLILLGLVTLEEQHAVYTFDLRSRELLVRRRGLGRWWTSRVPLDTCFGADVERYADAKSEGYDLRLHFQARGHYVLHSGKAGERESLERTAALIRSFLAEDTADTTETDAADIDIRRPSSSTATASA